MTDGYSGPWPSQLPSGSFPGMTPPPATVRRPATVKVSFWLIVAAAVVPLVLLPFTLNVVSDYVNTVLAQSAIQSRRALPPGFAQQFTQMIVPFAWVGGFIGLAVQVLLALGIWTGRNWVRILLTVLVGLNVLGSLSGLALGLAVRGFVSAPGYLATTPYATMTPLYGVGLAISAVQAVAIILAWLPTSNFFFAMSKAVRSGYRR
ncbi:hypothetical protein [Sinomonas sp. G460-2]|uniref:hypothetical protein n=1 Tax=Sinomonas sp. G460-2 TaxID=3393464 RepID=UPI0039EE5CC6